MGGVRLFKDQTCVFGQTQVVDPPVMNDKTSRIDEAISGSALYEKAVERHKPNGRAHFHNGALCADMLSCSSSTSSLRFNVSLRLLPTTKDLN